MSRAGLALACLLVACSGTMEGTPCGTTRCRSDTVCCTACGGRQYCADVCEEVTSCDDAGIPDAGATPDAGAPRDAGPGTDAGLGADAGPGTDAGTDAGPDTDAGTDAGPDTDAGTDAGSDPDAGTDAGADAGSDAGSDAGPLDAAVATDAGTDAGPMLDGSLSTGADAGPPPCPTDTCRVAVDSACEPPTGPTGNGCCECTASVCSRVCRCLAGDVLIATPSGEVAVTELAVGDLVYSQDHGAIVAVPILRTNASPVVDHVVVRVRLATGQSFRASPVHPTADGRRFGDLEVGDALDGVAILEAELEPYEGAFTYDILPDSDSGAYYVGGVAVGTTLR